MQKCYGWGSLTNYKVSNYHPSPPPFLHLLFTLQITKSTQVFSCLCCCSTFSLPHPHTSGTPKPQYISVCQRYPQLSWKKQLFLSKIQQNNCKMKQISSPLPVPCDFSRLCSVQALPGDPRRPKLPSTHSSMSNHVCPGPACGQREAFQWFGQFSLQPWGNIH